MKHLAILALILFSASALAQVQPPRRSSNDCTEQLLTLNDQLKIANKEIRRLRDKYEPR